MLVAVTRLPKNVGKGSTYRGTTPPDNGVCGVVTEANAGRLHLNGRAIPAPLIAAYFKKSRRFDMRVLSLLFLDFYEFSGSHNSSLAGISQRMSRDLAGEERG
jgi:hypothetical protein